MAKISRPRYGSLQFWPRGRAQRNIPRVNWDTLKSGEGLLGFIAYKAGMSTAILRDKTEKSMTLNKKIAIPVTILEVPKLKIYSVRFYKHGKVVKDVVVSNEAILKRVVKVPKQTGSLDKVPEHDHIRVIVYSVTKGMFRKAPTLAEVMVKSADPLGFVKGLVGKEISLNQLFKENLVDVRGVTKGKGLVGPVKRFGISLKSHKSEKGVRRPGSLGPWHPARVTYQVPLAGQLGMFTRIQYNMPIITRSSVGTNIPLQHGFKHYGKLVGDYILVAGSVQGPSKRELLLTPAFRPSKYQAKKKYELVELKL